jgi:hypothetical protein
MNFKIWTEAWEQQQLCRWLDNNWYFYSAVINDMYQTSYKQKAKAKALWLKSWCSDLIIKLKCKKLLFLEMKKAKWKRWWNNWSKESQHQLNWQQEINDIKNVWYEFAYWYINAIELIQDLEKHNKN